ncbi:WhiB family transcriptional regulator [Nocardiopsis terrae]|uniref:WhiB family transcriptional regulator n=1 Tax=Streptomyces sp. NPDC057554 TaxID=3350538 RepID=UPI00368AEA8D
MRRWPRGHAPACDTDPSWRPAAACRGEPLDLFFGAEGESDALRRVREAKAKEICWLCPVRDECLLRAMLVGDTGIRGAMTETERLEVRSRWVRRGLVVVVRGGYRVGEVERGDRIECDHCLRSGRFGGRGPGGMRLISVCQQRWERAGRPAQVPHRREVKGRAA